MGDLVRLDSADRLERTIYLANEVLTKSEVREIAAGIRAGFVLIPRTGALPATLEAPEVWEATMPKVGGKPFRCDCGGNVFSHLVGSERFICNSCQAEYMGER